MGFGSRSMNAGKAEALVRLGLDVGMTHFDTAEGYGFGRSERLLGLAGRGEEVVVTTKYFPAFPLPRNTRRHAERSRSRLGLARIPLFLLTCRIRSSHSASPCTGSGSSRIAGSSWG
jgi:aryl-alcohol dehydrogenase-like predicted oxidoreductase